MQYGIEVASRPIDGVTAMGECVVLPHRSGRGRVVPAAMGEFYAYNGLGQTQSNFFESREARAILGGLIVGSVLYLDMNRNKTSKMTPVWAGGLTAFLVWALG